MEGSFSEGRVFFWGVLFYNLHFVTYNDRKLFSIFFAYLVAESKQPNQTNFGENALLITVAIVAAGFYHCCSLEDTLFRLLSFNHVHLL